MTRLSLVIFTFLMSALSYAHPVSFQDSLGIMGAHSPTLTHNQVNYSYRYWGAVGLHHFRRPDLSQNNATFLSSNFLLKRWNEAALQANLYAVAGVGHSQLTDLSETSGMGLVQFDIEDRKYYFLAKHQLIVNQKQTDLSLSTVRLGVAPYQGDYEDIHAWLILDWQTRKFANEKTEQMVTPFLRVFHRNLLFEIGQSFNGATMFNYITHF